LLIRLSLLNTGLIDLSWIQYVFLCSYLFVSLIISFLGRCSHL
jgi:hypothetical protein